MYYCHNELQRGYGAGVWMTSCPEEKGWEFEDFKKSRQLRIWDWTMQADYWVSTIGAENGVLCHRVEFSTVAVAVKFFVARPAKINWDLKRHKVCGTLGDVVSIVWLRNTFKNCVSLLVSKNRTQNLIKPFISEQRSPPAFVYMYLPVCLHMYACSIQQLVIGPLCAIWA